MQPVIVPASLSRTRTDELSLHSKRVPTLRWGVMTTPMSSASRQSGCRPTKVAILPNTPGMRRRSVVFHDRGGGQCEWRRPPVRRAASGAQECAWRQILQHTIVLNTGEVGGRCWRSAGQVSGNCRGQLLVHRIAMRGPGGQRFRCSGSR
jgi:hypothetical protein